MRQKLMKYKIQVENVKKENIIDMAVTFTAMIRIFEKNSKNSIIDLLKEIVSQLDTITSKNEYDQIHSSFCEKFIKQIKTAEKNLKNGNIKDSKLASFGHAAKVLDIVLKVYIHYSSLPNFERANKIKPFLNGAIDTPILKYLVKKYTPKDITANSIEEIDQTQYIKLQELLKKDIKDKYENQIFPVEYDDILWNELNR